MFMMAVEREVRLPRTGVIELHDSSMITDRKNSTS